MSEGVAGCWWLVRLGDVVFADGDGDGAGCAGSVDPVCASEPVTSEPASEVDGSRGLLLLIVGRCRVNSSELWPMDK